MLNKKQQRFCEEYLVDLNGTQACIRAGYAKKSARSIANKLLMKDDIKAYIDALREEIQKRTEITVDSVLKRLDAVANRCMEAEPVMVKDESGAMVETGQYTFNASGANQALIAIGNHLGMFVKKVEDVTAPPKFESRSDRLARIKELEKKLKENNILPN